MRFTSFQDPHPIWQVREFFPTIIDYNTFPQTESLGIYTIHSINNILSMPWPYRDYDTNENWFVTRYGNLLLEVRSSRNSRQISAPRIPSRPIRGFLLATHTFITIT